MKNQLFKGFIFVWERNVLAFENSHNFCLHKMLYSKFDRETQDKTKTGYRFN